MKKIINIIIVSVLMSCSSNESRNKELTINIDSTSTPNIEVTRELPDKVFLRLLDSANAFKEGDPLPFFLYNHLLDYEYPWLTDHNDFSIRKLIIDSTTNMHFLEAVVSSNDVRLKRTADSSEVEVVALLEALPYRRLSNYDLVRMRLERKK